jgi:AcrR family transcriptional regulator
MHAAAVGVVASGAQTSVGRALAVPGLAQKRYGAHERLLAAVTTAVARDGYIQLTVERLQALAGVSRATFYQYFSSTDDCFANAYREHAELLVTRVLDALACCGQAREVAVLDALAGTALACPDAARLLMREGLAACTAGLRERDVLISRIVQAMTGASGRKLVQSKVDLPPTVLIGAAFRFISIRLAEGAATEHLGEELRELAMAFTLGASEPRWSERFAPAPSSHALRTVVRSRALQQRGSTRERILRATAAMIREKGYHGVNVADIVAAAGVSRRSFYNEVHSKTDAFTAAYEFGFQQTVAACTPAFFTPRVWPERVWHAAQAFTEFMAREPTIAYLGFVECHAAGPRFEAKVHETHLAFTLFLEEGYRQHPQDASPSRTKSVLATAAILEAGFSGSRSGTSLQIRRLQPLAVYIALTPFMGPARAGRFVARKLATKAHAEREA